MTNVVLDVFNAIEHRHSPRADPQRLLGLFHPDVEFHWPPSLPYGGTSRGLKSGGPTWGDTWDALQPTEAERPLDPRVVAASEDEVYEVRDGKLARAQMFYFDTVPLVNFLGRANGTLLSWF